MGAIFAPTRFSLVRISIRDLVADGKSLVRNSGVGMGVKIGSSNRPKKMIASTGFYRCCALGASAPVLVKNQSPSFFYATITWWTCRTFCVLFCLGGGGEGRTRMRPAGSVVKQNIVESVLTISMSKKGGLLRAENVP